MTTFYTEAEITARYRVTSEQMSKATRIIDLRTGKVFYQVESQTTPGTIYEVRFDMKHHCLTCTCPAGNPPVKANGDLAYAPRPCWHQRAAMAAAFEYRQQENLQARREAEEAARKQAEEDKARRAAYTAWCEGMERQRDEARALRKWKNPRGIRNTPFSFLR